MSFLGRNQHHTATTTAETEEKNDGKVFAGVVTFCVPQALECEDLGTISSDFQVGVKLFSVVFFLLSYILSR